MKNQDRGISTPVGILIILICVVAVGGLFLWQLGQWPKEEIKTVEDETADWKTYRNEEYGFEVKYPPGWIIIKENAEFVIFANEEEAKMQEEKRAGEIRCAAGIWLYHNEEELSVYDWAINKWGKPESRELGKISEVKINDLEGIKYEFMSMGMETNVVFSKNNKIINIQTTFDGCDNLYTIFNQMLSTFKFLLKVQGVINCGADFDCFIEASKTCDRAEGTFTTTVELLGKRATATSFREIRGREGEKCILYVLYKKDDITYTNEAINYYLDRGFTREKIIEMEQEINKFADELIEGKDGICKFENVEALTLSLEEEKKGHGAGGFQIGPEGTKTWYSGAECEGELFVQQAEKDECNSNSDCDDGSFLTEDTCRNPETDESRCSHTMFSNYAPSDQGEECTWNRDCGEGQECAKGKCVDNTLFENKIDCHEVSSGGIIEYSSCADMACGNCKSGRYSCLVLERTEDVEKSKCIQCISDKMCKPGLSCKNLECIK